MNENEEFEFRARQEAEASQQQYPTDMIDPTAGKTSALEDYFTKPSQDRDFSLKEVAGSALVGAGVGGGIGLAAGGIGAAPGAIAGGIYGAIGSIAGQITKMGGGSEAAALGVELISGGLASAAKNVAQQGAKAATTFLPWKERAMVKIAGLGDGITEEATKRVVGQTFGKKAPVLDYAKQTNQIGTQELLKKELANAGKQVPEDMKASDFLRDELYTQMDSLPPISKSPVARELSDDLDALISRGQATKAEKNNIIKAMNNQTSKNPRVASEAKRDILNLVQGGGAFKDAEGKMVTKINSAAQDVLKKRFSEYVATGPAGDAYTALKGVEKAEFVAAARDAIPQILGGGMKPAKIKELGANIAATPEGRAEFAQAFMQHLGSIDITKGASNAQLSNAFMKELRSLSPAVMEAGLMSGKNINAIQKTITNLPKNISQEAWRELAVRTVTASVMSGVGAQGGRAVTGEK